SRSLALWLGLSAVCGAGWAGTAWYRSRLSVGTDDAYVEGTVAPVSAKVPGQVMGVLVRDNELVKAGQVVIRLDARDYRAKAEQARAAVVMAERRFKVASARVGLGEGRAASQPTAIAAAQVAASEQRVAQAQRDLESAEADARMRESGFEPQQLGVRTAEARVLEARAQEQQAGALVQEVRVREAERDLAAAQLKEAEADLSMAVLNVEYTEIRAPIAGVVTRKNVEPGQVAQPGQALLAIVSLDDVWVIANLKETQLRSIRPGMRAEVVVDTFSDRTWKGTVDSIAAGTGSRFSLLPPENA